MFTAKRGVVMYRSFLKRFFDIALSLIAIIVLALPMALVALAVKLDSSGPVIFRQERLGRDGRTFIIYKFRSMCVNAEHTGTGVYSGAGDMRVTRVGKIIRATSLDELPQLFNIIKGDMSFIGPRPPLTYHPWEIEEYTPEQFRMFDVRPGITGWAQTHGRKEVEWHERIRLNVWYVDNLSLLLDIKIFFLTVLKVLKNEDNLNTTATLVETNEEKQESVSHNA